eukprot:gene17364-19101_t
MPQKLLTSLKNGLKFSQEYSKVFYKDFVSVRLRKTQKLIDDTFHISAVQEAQVFVSKAEQDFLEARRLSNEGKDKLEAQQLALKDARKSLDRCPREDANYLSLVSKEHSILIEEQKLRKDCEKNEQSERELFTQYSNAVRLSHEKERERAQKTKYWSIIGSISGTIMGFFGSSLITYYRLKQIKEIASPQLILKSIENLQTEVQNQNENNLEKTSAIIEKIVNQQSSEMNRNKTNQILNTECIDIVQQQNQFEDKLEEMSNVLIENSNRMFEDVKLSLQNQFHLERKNLTEHIDSQRSLMQEYISRDLEMLSKTLESSKKASSSDVDIARNKETENVNQEDIRSTNNWKEEAQLYVTLTSFVLLVYLTFSLRS